MYFNPRAKEKSEDFFNNEAAKKELSSAITSPLVPLIAVHGLRRTGKTSLIKVVLNLLGQKNIWIDGREISSLKDFQQKIYEGADQLKLFKVDRISVKGVEFSFNFLKKGLDYLNKKKVLIVIDEAQLLKKIKVDNIIAHIYDHYPKIKVVLSGSETGMLMSFLGKSNAEAPLYGRAVYEIQTQRLQREQSFMFLREGARQVKLSLTDDEIIAAIAKLDGIIGWLTKYGWYRLKFDHREALQKTIDEGCLIMKGEFAKFAAKAEAKYNKILKALKGGARWNELSVQTKISDKQLATMMHRLVDYGFVEKENQVYNIADPLLEAAMP